MKLWLLIIPLLFAAGLAAACNSKAKQTDPLQPQAAPLVNEQPAPTTFAQTPAAPTLTFTTQSNDEKAVWVDVTPLNLPGGDVTLDFEVAFNTHSVDLSFDPAAISLLRDDAGREYPATAWEGSGPGGHHRSGILHFDAPDQATTFVEVVIHDVAGVPERVFHWPLTPQEGNADHG